MVLGVVLGVVLEVAMEVVMEVVMAVMVVVLAEVMEEVMGVMVATAGVMEAKAGKQSNSKWNLKFITVMIILVEECVWKHHI